MPNYAEPFMDGKSLKGVQGYDICPSFLAMEYFYLIYQEALHGLYTFFPHHIISL